MKMTSNLSLCGFISSLILSHKLYKDLGKFSLYAMNNGGGIQVEKFLM
jgi:hypothetical protein